MTTDSHPPDQDGTQEGSDEGQVSEVSGLQQSGAEAPGDATAGYPGTESGDAQEGTAGPNAAPRHDPPEPGNASSR